MTEMIHRCRSIIFTKKLELTPLESVVSSIVSNPAKIYQVTLFGIRSEKFLRDHETLLEDTPGPGNSLYCLLWATNIIPP